MITNKEELQRKLIKVNQILEEISQDIPEITPVSTEDIELFDSFFRTTEPTYGNSWTYVTQGVYGTGPNNLGYKYYDGENLSMICVYPKIEEPSVNMFYWIRPIGKNITNVIKNISAKIMDKIGIESYVKKIFEEQLNDLSEKDFVKVDQNYPWHPNSYSEDDTYPEIIFNAKESVELAKTLPRRKHLRKSFQRVVQIQEKYEVEISSRDFEKYAWSIVNDFFQYIYKHSDKVNLSNPFDYYNMIFNNPDREGLMKKIVYVDGVPLGMLVGEENHEYFNLNALIILRNKMKFLVDYTLVDLFTNIDKKYINMGGSEDEGIHNFKLKYMPQRTQQMYWATNHIDK